MTQGWRCRLGFHRWTLWPQTLRQEAGESPYYCRSCGREPLTV